MDRLRGVLFDNDGTLVDTYGLILSSFQHAMRVVLDREMPESTLMAKVGQPLAEQMKDFSDNPMVQEELLRVYREFNHERHDSEVRVFPGVLEGLRRMRDAGFALGVVTSKMHWLAWRGLEVTGAAPFLQCCIGADDCSTFKPAPDPVIAGAHALGLRPGECLYVGDSPFDIAAGNAAGCRTVAALWGMFSRDALAAETPTFYCESFDDLVALVEGEARV